MANFPVVDPMSGKLAETLKRDLRALLRNRNLRTRITYTHFEGAAAQTVNLETGAVTRGDSGDQRVNALRRTATAEEVANSGGRLERDDRLYLIEQSKLSLAPTTNDTLADGGETFSVVMWEEDPLGFAYLVAARRV